MSRQSKMIIQMKKTQNEDDWNGLNKFLHENDCTYKQIKQNK